jgi:hypothetical protein
LQFSLQVASPETFGYTLVHFAKYHLSDKIWGMRWTCRKMGEMRNAYNILVGKPEGKRQLGRPKHGWEDDIGTYRREVVWEGVDWFHLAQDRD